MVPKWKSVEFNAFNSRKASGHGKKLADNLTIFVTHPRVKRRHRANNEEIQKKIMNSSTSYLR